MWHGGRLPLPQGVEQWAICPIVRRCKKCFSGGILLRLCGFSAMLPIRGRRQNRRGFRWLSQGADAYEFTGHDLHLPIAGG
ncbi:hypothetical protein SFOMI_1666 [Sphingobium fuliginis]|uniref:Uncharacterized protein n=1 Tax=Sphingobium fuliginis (strain ATCC 27551) TaxID=336203 RepID=A0A292Z7G9_SPHSA|nr:hypothetical protein SFOMI_1666 [Sphingobium fuliginis]